MDYSGVGQGRDIWRHGFVWTEVEVKSARPVIVCKTQEFCGLHGTLPDLTS